MVVLLIMDGLRLLVPLIISEESSLASDLYRLAESGDALFTICRFRDVGGEHFLFVQDEMFALYILIVCQT